MIDDLKALFDIVESIWKKRRVSEAEKTRDKVLIAIYKLGADGRQAVEAERLEKEADFSKVDIIRSIETAKAKDWIIDASTLGVIAWALKPEADYYVRGLLGE